MKTRVVSSSSDLLIFDFHQGASGLGSKGRPGGEPWEMAWAGGEGQRVAGLPAARGRGPPRAPRILSTAVPARGDRVETDRAARTRPWLPSHPPFSGPTTSRPTPRS